jgi:hypothetical protein
VQNGLRTNRAPLQTSVCSQTTCSGMLSCPETSAFFDGRSDHRSYCGFLFCTGPLLSLGGKLPCQGKKDPEQLGHLKGRLWRWHPREKIPRTQTAVHAAVLGSARANGCLMAPTAACGVIGQRHRG